MQIQQIPDSAEKNDAKLYFFFREKSLDSSGGASPTVLARVGRVCLVSARVHAAQLVTGSAPPVPSRDHLPSLSRTTRAARSPW